MIAIISMFRQSNNHSRRMLESERPPELFQDLLGITISFSVDSSVESVGHVRRDKQFVARKRGNGAQSVTEVSVCRMGTTYQFQASEAI